MSVTVRFAPSPTGLLQAGNGRAAILNCLFALKSSGRFLLRIDDTDVARSHAEYEEAILTDLAWLGIGHDLFARQSDRIDEYRAAAERLKASGRLYACYETADELERKRRLRIAQKKPPVYDRASLSLSDAKRAEFEAQGRRPHWRFKLSQKMIGWTDLIRGEIGIDTGTVSDPVLIREDGQFLYTLPSVFDDISFGISHIIRGEDHVTNTAAQIEIFEALGVSPPLFAHFPLFVTAEGAALSKRMGSLSLKALREEGIEPLALAAYLAKIGTSDAVEPRNSLAELAHEFSFDHIGRAPARFSEDELKHLNTRFLHGLGWTDVAPRLAEMGITDPRFWEAARSNVERMSDCLPIWHMVEGPVTPQLEQLDLLEKAAATLPPEPWDESTWNSWTARIKDATGAKGRDLFHPLRLALTGSAVGPELRKVLPLIGRAKVLARLRGKIA